MKNNKILILLLLQGLCCVGFAQNPCEPMDLNLYRQSQNLSQLPNLLTARMFPFSFLVIPTKSSVWKATTHLRARIRCGGCQRLAYTIYFENDAELAMAAASKVSITMPLHEKLNYATFGVGSTYIRSSKSSVVASLTCVHDIMLEIPLAHCVRGGMVLPPSGIKPPRKHSLTQTCDNRVV